MRSSVPNRLVAADRWLATVIGLLAAGQEPFLFSALRHVVQTICMATASGFEPFGCNAPLLTTASRPGRD